MLVITDVCLCEYMDHGHCGIVHRDHRGTRILNDPTLKLLARAAASHAEAGADIVAPSDARSDLPRSNVFERNLIFYLGLGILVMVPAFKTATGLPPFMGILFGLGILWAVGELIHRGKEDDRKKHLTLVHALTRIDMSSIVFATR